MARVSTIILSAVLIGSVTSFKSCSSVLDDRCIQKCNHTSCQCGGRGYQGCTQMCGRYPCKTILCVSGTCIQSCHGCTMECTSDVEFCVQRCLSGRCEIKCAAQRCETDCVLGNCKITRKTESKAVSTFPKSYLLLLAGCFAATTILSLIALCLSCRAMRRRRRNTYQRLRPVPSTPPQPRNIHATRHGQFEREDDSSRTLNPQTIRIGVLPLPEKPV